MPTIWFGCARRLPPAGSNGFPLFRHRIETKRSRLLAPLNGLARLLRGLPAGNVYPGALYHDPSAAARQHLSNFPRRISQMTALESSHFSTVAQHCKQVVFFFSSTTLISSHFVAKVEYLVRLSHAFHRLDNGSKQKKAFEAIICAHWACPTLSGLPAGNAYPIAVSHNPPACDYIADSVARFEKKIRLCDNLPPRTNQINYLKPSHLL